MNKHTQRAQMLLQLGRYEQAEKESRKAIAAAPDDDFAHRLLALALSNQARLRLRSARAAKKPLFRRGHDRQAEILELRHEAVREAQHAVHLAPEEPYNHYVLAVVLAGLEDLDAARTSLSTAIRLAPREAEFHAYCDLPLAGVGAVGALAVGGG